MKKLLLASAVLALFAAASGQESVTLPANPANPGAGRVLALREVFRVSDAQGGFYFKSPAVLRPVPGGGLLVVDDDELLRFDAAGKLVVNMFRPGQGPGELRQITDVLVRGGEVLAFQEQPLKCVVTGLDGKFLREFRPSPPVSRLLGLYGHGLLMAANSPIPFDKVQKPEGDILDIVWTLALATAEGTVTPTSLAYATKWFAKRLPGAMIADNLTFLLCAPLADGLFAVANEEAYIVHIVDPGKNAALRTIRRDYRRVKYEPEKPSDSPDAPRRLAQPRAFFSDIQRLFSVDGNIWAVTSTVVPGKGALVDVIGPRGEFLDSFYLPLPKDVGPHDLARYPLAIDGRSLFVLEELEDGRLEVVKYEIAGR